MLKIDNWRDNLQPTIQDFRNNGLILLAGICLGLAISLFAGVSIKQQISANLVLDQMADVAKLAADRAGQSLFNNDLLGLQVILTDVAELRQVQGVTVHDVENRILAQAGDILDPNQSIYQSAAITQNENVAGYITVIASKPATSNTNFWLALFALAGAIICATLHSRQQGYDNSDAARVGEPNTAEHTSDDWLDQDRETELSAINEHAVSLALFSENIHKLAEQLNSEAFDKQYQPLKQTIHSVASLYNAQFVGTGHTLPALLFNSSDEYQNSLNALCSGQLILALMYRLGSPFDMQLRTERFLANHNSEQQLRHRIFRNEHKLHLGISEPLANLVADRIETTSHQGYWRSVVAFDDAYQSLLDNQLKQLISANANA